MTDELGGTSTARVPAWKLRQQQRQNRPPPALESRRRNNDELGGTRSLSNNDELGGARMPNASSSGGRVPAWKLREMAKRREKNDLDDSISVGTTKSTSSDSSSSNVSFHSSRTMPSVSVSSLPDAAPDPSLPPAFRAAFNKQQERKKNKDNFLSMSSMHSRTTACSNNTMGDSEDSFASLDSDADSFDGEDSFASLDSDADEDDEAYRESRNQMARLEIEKQQRMQDAKRVGTGTSRFKKKSVGVHGTPLGFIAE